MVSARPYSLVDARALTLRQPWAQAVCHLGKRVENRSWSPPEDLDVLLIHAGQAVDLAGARWMRQLGHDVAGGSGPSGAIVAVARLAHVCNASLERGLIVPVCGCGPWAMPGQYHWVLADVWTLAEPVPCKGRQKLWRPPVDVVDAVRAQLVRGPT